MQRKSGQPAKKMFFSFLFACVLWDLVIGYDSDDSDDSDEIDDSQKPFYNSHEDLIYPLPKDHDHRYPYARLHKNRTGLREQFQRRHVNRTFSKWPELHAAQPEDFNKVCKKWASVNSTNIPTPHFKLDEFFLYGEETRSDTFSIDMLECEVILHDPKGEEFARLTYYLCDGDEPGTAFRFSQIHAWQNKSVNLLEKVWNVWDGTSLDDES